MAARAAFRRAYTNSCLAPAPSNSSREGVQGDSRGEEGEEHHYGERSASGDPQGAARDLITVPFLRRLDYPVTAHFSRFPQQTRRATGSDLRARGLRCLANPTTASDRGIRSDLRVYAAAVAGRAFCCRAALTPSSTRVRDLPTCCLGRLPSVLEIVGSSPPASVDAAEAVF